MTTPLSRNTKIALTVAALAVLVILGLLTRGGTTKNSQPATASSSSTTMAIEPQSQNNGDGTATSESTQPSTEAAAKANIPQNYSALVKDQYDNVRTRSNQFMKAWATKYGDADKRAKATAPYATKSLTERSRTINEAVVPDVSKVKNCTVDTDHSTNITPVLTCDVGTDTYYVLLQSQGDDPSNPWLVDQLLTKLSFMTDYDRITPTVAPKTPIVGS